MIPKTIKLEEIPNAFDYGLGTQCKPKTGDWNDTCGNSSGFYMGHDLSNAPTTDWIYVIHLVHNELFAKQIALAFFSADMWIRQKNSGEWSEWTKLH